MPQILARLRLRYRLDSDPFDPRDNILAGAGYLREMYDRYGAAGFLAAYNAGPPRYDAYLATGRPLPAETRAYVAALAPLMAVLAAAVQHERSLVAIRVTDLTGFIPQSSGLFVAVSARKPPP